MPSSAPDPSFSAPLPPARGPRAEAEARPSFSTERLADFHVPAADAPGPDAAAAPEPAPAPPAASPPPRAAPLKVVDEPGEEDVIVIKPPEESLRDILDELDDAGPGR